MSDPLTALARVAVANRAMLAAQLQPSPPPGSRRAVFTRVAHCLYPIVRLEPIAA